MCRPSHFQLGFCAGQTGLRFGGTQSRISDEGIVVFFPLGYFLKAIGGIPVPRKRGSSLSDAIVAKFNSCTRMALAITPEGTRSRTTEWRHGFLHIAYNAGIPIALGVMDYPTKMIMIENVFIPTGDVEADMRTIKDFYRNYTGKYPEKFSAEY